MANLDRPRGIWPFGLIKQQIVMVAGSAIMPGEVVGLANDGMLDAAAATADGFGVALGYASASGDKILISVDGDQIYVGQADETEIDAQTDVGNLCDLEATAESTVYNASRHEIDSSSVGTSGGLFVILGIEARPDNALGGFVDCKVKINENQIWGETDFAGI